MNRKKDDERYIYSSVPFEVFAEMLVADSIGKFFYSEVKNVFEFRKEDD